MQKNPTLRCSRKKFDNHENNRLFQQANPNIRITIQKKIGFFNSEIHIRGIYVDKIDNIIKNIPSFSGLSEEQMTSIRHIVVEKKYLKGEMVFGEGDEGKGFYIVLEGLVKVFKTSADGKEQILHILGPGEPLGEVAVFAGRSFPANALALANSRLLYLPRLDFVDLITQNPSLAMNMLAVLSMRLRQFTVQIESLTLKEVPGRLAAYLVYLAEEQENDKSVILKISKGSLAGLLGTIPETLSRIFAKMSDQGLIKVNGREIELIHLEEIKEIAEYGKKME
jgi:CRP-like cAMP-binding protein